MYVRKVAGPVSVRGLNGELITRADLPPEDTVRWVAGRKAIVVAAVQGGMLTEEEACEKYSLSADELAEWMTLASEHGSAALKTTKIKNYR
ncbi:DUF1153 domain-containing protein [Paracoccaceae bacterium GXU_MW_L88]